MKTAALEVKSSSQSHRDRSLRLKQPASHFFSDSNEGATPFFDSRPLQTQQPSGRSGDHLESEAEQAADIAIKRINSENFFFSKGQAPPDANVPISITSISQTAVQNTENHDKTEGDEIQSEELVQRKAAFEGGEFPPEDGLLQFKKGANSTSSSFDIAEGLKKSKGGGTPISEKTRHEMEGAFQADFSNVRLHMGSDAIQMNQALNAQAFTHGNDIYFNAGKYKPESNTGKHLLAHELTHTIQQGGGRKAVQRAKNIIAPSGEQQGPPYRVKNIELDPVKKVLKIPSITLPWFKGRNKTLFSSGITSTPNRRKQDRNTDELRLWKNEVREAVHNKVDALLGPAKKQGDYVQEKKGAPRIFFLKPSNPWKNRKLRLIGGITSLKAALLKPDFDRKAEPRHHSVDHVVEWKLLNGADDVSNFELLDLAANASSGSIVKNTWDKTVRSILRTLKKHLTSTASPLPDFDSVKDGYTVIFENVSFKSKVGGDPKKYWSRKEIIQGEHLKRLQPMSIREIQDDKEGLTGMPNRLVLFPLRNSGNPLHIDWVVGTTSQTLSKPVTNWIPNFTLQQVHFNPASNSDKVGSVIGTVFARNKFVGPINLNIDLNKLPGVGYGGYLDRKDLESSLKKILKWKPLSPLDIVDVVLDQQRGIVIKGLITASDIQFLKNLSIEILFIGEETILKTTLGKDNISLPDPFSVSNAAISISASRSRFTFNGNIDFEIEKVGEGSVTVSIDDSYRVKLDGTFDVASDMFEESEIRFSYMRNPGGENAYTIGGQVRVGPGKIRGLKKAYADVEVGNKQLKALGIAQPDINGFEEIKMSLTAEQGKFEFGGEVKLVGIIPFVKQGIFSIHVTRDDQEGYKIAGKGFVVPDLPDMEGATQILLSFNEGAFLIEGEVPFSWKKANAKGTLKLGITNQQVDENGQPTGVIGEEWTFFGVGNASIILGRGIGAQVDITLTPTKEIIVSGSVGLDTNNLDNQDRTQSFKDTLFEVGPPPIVLFLIPPIGASLVLRIKGGARVYAFFVPPHFKELSLGLENFNLTNPDDNFAITGKVAVGMSGRAGVELYLTLEATLSVLIAKVTGKLIGSLGLEATANALASLEARWSKADGLSLLKGQLALEADTRFVARLRGGIRVFLDLLLAEIDIWEEEIVLAEKEFGPSYNLKLIVPVWMENGELQMGSLSKESFEYPNVKSDSKQQELVESAVNEDEKVKPPPPPSKEEAIRVVKRAPAGMIHYGTIVFSTPDEIRARGIFGLINRDTYVKWLTLYYSDLSWHEVEQASLEKDLRDFEQTKNQLYELRSSSADFSAFVSKEDLKDRIITDFLTDHLLFVQRNPGAYYELRDINVSESSRPSKQEEEERLHSKELS